jgi:hypothetical protein
MSDIHKLHTYITSLHGLSLPFFRERDNLSFVVKYPSWQIKVEVNLQANIVIIGKHHGETI